MYRTAIFCFYDKMGVIGEDDLFLLKELNECASYVVVVVNGELKNRDNLQYLADKIIYRKNTSYDAGAYKEALLKQECREVIEKSDELILCNNSFWGPFVHFSCIFKEMEKSKADFWGLNDYQSESGLQAALYVIVHTLTGTTGFIIERPPAPLVHTSRIIPQNSFHVLNISSFSCMDVLCRQQELVS